MSVSENEWRSAKSRSQIQSNKKYEVERISKTIRWTDDEMMMANMYHSISFIHTLLHTAKLTMLAYDNKHTFKHDVSSLNHSFWYNSTKPWTYSSIRTTVLYTYTVFQAKSLELRNSSNIRFLYMCSCKLWYIYIHFENVCVQVLSRENKQNTRVWLCITKCVTNDKWNPLLQAIKLVDIGMFRTKITVIAIKENVIQNKQIFIISHDRRWVNSHDDTKVIIVLAHTHSVRKFFARIAKIESLGLSWV